MPPQKPSSASVRSIRSQDLSIRGDEQERHRIQLEHNLQTINDLSIHLSSSKDDSTVEYPRHAEHTSPFPAIPSFHHHHSVDNLDADDHSHMHPWSYRTLDEDDENGVHPYVGQSLSTAGHHASAITFTAGLGGRRRGDQTQSGAEYDPDRPLHNMIAGVDSRLSMFGNTMSKSNHMTSTQLMFDPLVVDGDDTAQLDRVLNTGRAPLNGIAAQLRSPLASSSSSSYSSSPQSPRPKLSDALSHVAFSPKRPRSAQAHISPRVLRNPPRHPVSPSPGKLNFDAPTPRPRSKTSHPQMNIQPPTPSGNGSKFTKMARGIAKEIETEQMRAARLEEEASALAHSTVRDRSRMVKGRRPTAKPSPRGRVYLPDVTGLTSAIESPARIRLDYNRYDAQEDRECDARILATLSVVQSKLAFLESENSISRRRVKELELELEACKKEVARERTRILAMEIEDVERQHAATMRAHAELKGKSKAYSTSLEDQSRYKEAVEEKKALEALISSLRSHLSRLTSELSSHQSLLAELRSLRDADARALQAKSDDVDMLREQVERLAGEVEVLKGVVEEGLKERRMVREQSLISAEDEDHDLDAKRPQAELDFREQEAESSDATSDEEESIGSRTPPRIAPRNFDKAADKTMRTDFATGGSQSGAPFITSEEIDRISLDLDDRRSNRSGGSSLAGSTASQQPRSVTSLEYTMQRAASPEATPPERVARPAAPTPAHALNNGDSHNNKPRPQRTSSNKDVESPFPQIRGGRLERLFFSAPEHNTRTCTVCQRSHRHGHNPAPSWLPSRFASDARHKGSGDSDIEDDEGFAEGSDDNLVFGGMKGKARGIPHNDRRKLPPQTVLARVLRELEDDFTHYKGIYVELSDQYKLMDAISNVAKRNVLAEHLREVIDILEQKGDQIASLYDLLKYEDKPVAPTKQQQEIPGRRKHPTTV